LKDIHNSQHRYLLASENQRPGHLSTAPMGSLTVSPSSGSLCSPTGLQSVCSIQERIMSTPGGEEAIERLKKQFNGRHVASELCSRRLLIPQPTRT
ncbi:kinesin-like protein KIF1B isoform X1, partial [Tachysurus ichikawai]